MLLCFTQGLEIRSFYCSCLKIILDVLEKLLKPDINALLHEFAFQVGVVCHCIGVYILVYFPFHMICQLTLSCRGCQSVLGNCYKSLYFGELIIGYYMQLLYELCTDPLTCNPMMDLLSTKKYWFFVQVRLCRLKLFCILFHILENHILAFDLFFSIIV